SPPKVLDHTEHPAGEIEPHASDSAELARDRQLLEGERNVLEKIMSNSSLDEALSLLAQVVEQQGDELLCSILLYDAAQGRLFHGAAPSIPAPYIQAVHGVKVGPEVGSCGASVYRRVTTIVEDIATHPNWTAFRDVALAHGLRACWSTP